MRDGSVLLVDFDNVFTALWAIDGGLAIRFASDPGRWLRGLANTEGDEVTRRWLVARCYMNPSGWVSAPGEQNDRLWFYRFRSDFVRAGFEVVDCPTLTRGAKNAADIRMVVDALELLDRRTRFDEFVFVSGDADFTPLLHRLRGEDRKTTILAPGPIAAAYSAVADEVFGLDQISTFLGGSALTPSESAEVGTLGGDDQSQVAMEAFATLVRRRYAEARTPLNLSTLSSEVVRTIPASKSTEWFGQGTFRKALDELSLPDVRFSQHHLWDERRHQPPSPPPSLEIATEA